MTFEVTRYSNALLVKVAATASVRTVAEAKSVLLGPLRDDVAVTLDLTGTDLVDAAFVQLITSARRSFAAKSVTFEVHDPARLVDAAFTSRAGAP